MASEARMELLTIILGQEEIQQSLDLSVNAKLVTK